MSAHIPIVKTLFSLAIINRKHNQERSYDDWTNTKKPGFSKRQTSVLRASSTLGTTCEQGSGCAGAVVPESHGAEEFCWHLSLLMLSMCACSCGAGGTAGSTAALDNKRHHHHHQQD